MHRAEGDPAEGWEHQHEHDGFHYRFEDVDRQQSGRKIGYQHRSGPRGLLQMASAAHVQAPDRLRVGGVYPYAKIEGVGGAFGQQRRTDRQRGDLTRLRLTAVIQPQLQTPVWPNAGRLAPCVGAANVGEMHAPLIGWAVGIKKPEFAFGLFC